jgi:tetratricopeptide (TPR) repeat protein
MIASNYRNLADIYFNSAKYVTAGKYFDSTLVKLKPRTREFNLIKKKRENLDDVIKYEGIVQRNDSILSLSSMSADARTAFFEKYIVDLKKKEELAKKVAAKKAQIAENKARNEGAGTGGDGKIDLVKTDAVPQMKDVASISGGSTFYFYNQATVAYGKKEFTKIWGKKTLGDNWRSSATKDTNIASKEDDDKGDVKDSLEDPKKGKDTAATADEYSPEFYVKQLPTGAKVLDSLAKERNFAYYQLGIIYKEKFKENKLAVAKFEQLLKNQPEERLVLPAMYNLYKLYEILNDQEKAAAMKAEIISKYPNSRYAQILSNPSSEEGEDANSPKAVYEKIYKQYLNGDYKAVLTATEESIELYNGDPILPKFELLKAKVVAKFEGLDSFGKGLNYVSLTYPNTEEGKKATALFTVDLPKLEALQLSTSDSKNWKILYQTKDFEDKNTKVLVDKIKKFLAERDLKRLSLSYDMYTMTDNFVVIHGVTSKDLATSITTVLKEYKDYKVQDTPIILTAGNYAVIQIKKNLDEFLAGKLVDNPAEPAWDGTYEKPAEPQKPKPEARATNEQPAGEDSEGAPGGGNSKGMNSNMPPGGAPSKGDQKGMGGLPPAPQMGNTGKKG